MKGGPHKTYLAVAKMKSTWARHINEYLDVNGLTNFTEREHSIVSSIVSLRCCQNGAGKNGKLRVRKMLPEESTRYANAAFASHGSFSDSAVLMCKVCHPSPPNFDAVSC